MSSGKGLRKRHEKLDKRRLRKLLNPSNPKSKKISRIVNKTFKRYEKFVGCNEALEKLFVPAHGEYYRIVHKPPQFNDQLVQSEQKFEGLAPSMCDLPEIIELGSNIKDQFDHISDWSLSFNVDDNKLAKVYWDNYDLRKNEKKKREFVIRKGDVMALYRLTPEAGVIQAEPDNDGHVVLVEYADFILENYRITEFGLKSLTDYANEKK